MEKERKRLSRENKISHVNHLIELYIIAIPREIEIDYLKIKEILYH